jgi:hypothetical protein
VGLLLLLRLQVGLLLLLRVVLLLLLLWVDFLPFLRLLQRVFLPLLLVVLCCLVLLLLTGLRRRLGFVVRFVGLGARCL